jgi:hypothetical protein
MLHRNLTNDKWLMANQQFLGDRLCVEETRIADHKWSFYIEYVGCTLMCVTYIDNVVQDMFPLSRLFL